MNDMIDFFMDPLRLTLIIAGVVVLFAIVIFSRKSNRSRDFTYSSPSSKEFSFGSQSDDFQNVNGAAGVNGPISDALAKDVLVDEEVIVLPRKRTESEAQSEAQSEMADSMVGASVGQQPQPQQHKSTNNAYNIKTEPEKSTVNEFRAYQARSADDQMGSDIFDDEILPSSKHLTENDLPVDTEVKKEKKKPVYNMAKETFVVLHVIAAEGKPFNGLDILDATKTLGLAFGKHAIFHYPMSAAPAGDSKFCLVNMSAEGNFKTNKISSLETNGISLIMRLPIRGADSLTVFSNMLGVTQALARKLGGEILDQTRMPLTAEIVESVRSDIAHFDKSIELSSVNAHSAKEPVPEL